MANILVFEATQTTDKVNKCRYALLKYLAVYNLKPPAGISVFVYTDQPALFESFIPFFYHFHMKEISGAQIKEWQSEKDYPERLKIEIIREVFHNLQGSLLYLNTGFYITQPIDAIFTNIENHIFYLQANDSSANTNLYKLKQFLATASVEYNGKKTTFSPDMQIFKTGIIGIDSAQKELLNDVQALANAFYKQFHNHAAEPFSFSYCFQKTGEVKTAPEQIKNYSSLKESGVLLKAFFKKNEEESIPNLVKLVHHLDMASIEKSKMEYETLPFYKKWMRALGGRQWSIKKYQRKF